MRKYIWLILLLTIVAAFGIGGALALSLKGGDGFKYEQEWVHALLQAGLIAVLGIVTSGVLERFKDTLQQRRDDSKLRFDVLTELSRAYMDIKLVRRKMQTANGFLATETDLLNQIQVVVELHKRNSVRLFRQGSELEGHLRDMERYLNKVANKADSPQRSGFCSDGFKDFSNAYEMAAMLIRNGIAGR
jgi:prepilin signal peptidase PulO-like enzyme (type II secretory pathway)